MNPKIISIGFAVPEHSYSQEEIFQELGYPRILRRLFTGADIEKRHFCIPLEQIRKLSFQEQQEQYARSAVELSKQALINCLDGRKQIDIACIIYGSCTGLTPGPTIPHYLIKEVGFLPQTYVTNIIGQGCESGFPGIKRAYDFVFATGKPAVVINCELASLTYFPEPDGKPDSENHYELARSNTIFADAAVAALVGMDENWRHPEIIDTETFTNIEYLKDLGYTWRDGRLRVLLSRRVPTLVPGVVKPAVDAVLKRQTLKAHDIKWWVIHAAGSTVLDNIRDALGISEEKMRLSRETLKNYGNTSSTSVGITGKKLMLENIEPGDYVAIISVGPGMTGGICLSRFGGG